MSTLASTSPAEQTLDEQRERLRYRRLKARKIRREREEATEIRELNIVAMMDMMTIILVFLLKSYSASSISMTASEEVRPPLSTARATPKEMVAVTITPRSILVGDKKVIELEQGRIPPAQLQGRLVKPLDQALRKEVGKLEEIALRNPDAPFTGQLSVIADKRVPYDLLLTVLYTAGQNKLESYRFIVVQKDGDEAK